MISDVPLGAFLSGGIDSSTVVALMKKAAGAVKTFSIGFEEDGFNEAQHAREVARHIGTEHTELMLTGADALKLVPSLPAIYDEPFADSSQLPTYLVSHLARQHVTVSLSGDGGDEVFGGYVRYQGVDRLWRALRRVPRPLRHAAASAVQMGSADFWDAVAGPVPRRLKPAHVGDKIVKASRLFLADGPLDMYQRLIAQWPEPGRALRNWSGEAPQATDLGGLDTISQLRLMDMRGYLPNDILTKVDRASMAVSLEVRVPLLDHRVVEFSWRLPSQMLVRGAGPICSAPPDRPAEDGFRRPDRRLDPRPVARMGGGPIVTLVVRAGRIIRCGFHPFKAGRAPVRPAQLAVCALDDPAVPGLAPGRTVGRIGTASVGSAIGLKPRTRSGNHDQEKDRGDRPRLCRPSGRRGVCPHRGTGGRFRHRPQTR